MNTPLLTIGLPVYNARPYLEDTLRSIFAQTFQDWELVIFDDGSTDGSGAFLERVKDPRIRMLGSKRNRGLAAALNLINDEARGQYIARMDADDVMHPERMSRQFAFLERCPEVDVLGCSLVSVGRHGEPRGARVFPAGHEAITQASIAGPRLCHATVMARTSWWRRFRYREQNRGCEDLELWMAAQSSSRFANLPDLLYYYREYSSFSLPKYVLNRARSAGLAWHVRDRGMARAAADIAGHMARAGLYVIATGLGLRDQLIARRSEPLSLEQQEGYRAALARVRATPLPDVQKLDIQQNAQ